MKKLIISLIYGLAFLVTVVHAGVYKWSDKDGNVHYGDQPATQKKATEVNIVTKPATGFSVSSEKKKERDRVLEEFKEDREARDKKRKDKITKKKKLKKQCARARDTLRRFREASAVYKLNSKGERVFYPKEVRAKKERKIKKAIKKHCN